MYSIHSVAEVTRRIKNLIDGDEVLGDLWIEGEISDFTQASSGHCYFTLQDSGDGTPAEIRCVIWRSQAWRLTWRPQPGDTVEAHGYISVYERGGAYQFYADTLLQGGVGQRWRAFQALKARLEAEGLFDASRKRPIPHWPKCIGVVTSPSGAALHDILNVLRNRYPLVQVLLSPALVQGIEAPSTIVKAIKTLDEREDVDVVIVARGGGSAEDLWAFNDEEVGRAIIGSRAPVITGIGHETDFTIADFCADLRAPTPSAAAAAAVPDRQELWDELFARMSRLTNLATTYIADRRQRVDALHTRLHREAPLHVLGEFRQRIDDLVRRGWLAIQGQMRLQRTRLGGSRDKLVAMDPRTVLLRGYAVVQNRTTGERIHSIHQLAANGLVDVLFTDGRAGAHIVDIAPHRWCSSEATSPSEAGDAQPKHEQGHES
jgi:exodeoxyribonuclease VII large subunit